MPNHKNTTILSEIGKFIDKKDTSSAMINIIRGQSTASPL